MCSSDLCNQNNKSTWFSFNTSIAPIKTLATVTTSFKAPPKDQQKKEIKRQIQILAEMCQNRTAGKDEFVRKSSVAQIKKWSTNIS